jgi:hypothetical protein
MLNLQIRSNMIVIWMSCSSRIRRGMMLMRIVMRDKERGMGMIHNSSLVPDYTVRNNVAGC